MSKPYLLGYKSQPIIRSTLSTAKNISLADKLLVDVVTGLM